MVKESKLDTAHRLFLENCYGWEVKSRTRSLNLLIDAFCQSNHSDLALQVFQEMNHQCCYPDRETYQILMRGLCDGRLNEATHLLYLMFWRISQKGSGEDDVIYRTLLDALCDNGQVEEAVEILDGEDVVIYRILLEEMHDNGFIPTLLIYEAKVAALCREGRVDNAVEVIEREMVEGNCVPTVGLYNTVIKGLCDERKSALAIGCLEKISRQVGCVPNRETCTILVDGLCHDGKYIEASQVMEEMLINSYWPSVDLYNTLIQGLCLISRPYEAFMWLEEMVSQAKMSERSVWDSLVASVCSDMVVTEIYFETLERLRKNI